MKNYCDKGIVEYNFYKEKLIRNYIFGCVKNSFCFEYGRKVILSMVMN